MRIHGISILRIFACFGVFLAHLGQRLHVTGTTETVLDYGIYGVELFFIISGYLAYCSWNKKSNDFSTKRIIKYYYKRCIRILPLYYFCILFFFITEVFVWHNVPFDNLGLYWTRYAFLLNIILPSGDEFWRNLGATWTIPIFMLFYFLFPLIARFVTSFYRACVLFVVSFGIRVIVEQFGNGWFSAFRYIPFFVFGIIVYFASLEHKSKLVIVLSALGLMICTLSFIDVMYQFILIFIILIIVSKDYVIKNRAGAKIIEIIDSYTYPIYLVHAVVFCGIIDKFEFSKMIIVLVALFGTLFLTILTHHLVEIPVQRYLKKKDFCILLKKR